VPGDEREEAGYSRSPHRLERVVMRSSAAVERPTSSGRRAERLCEGGSVRRQHDTSVKRVLSGARECHRPYT